MNNEYQAALRLLLLRANNYCSEKGDDEGIAQNYENRDILQKPIDRATPKLLRDGRYCPNCGQDKGYHYHHTGVHFCSKCGQAIEWEK